MLERTSIASLGPAIRRRPSLLAPPRPHTTHPSIPTKGEKKQGPRAQAGRRRKGRASANILPNLRPGTTRIIMRVGSTGMQECMRGSHSCDDQILIMLPLASSFNNPTYLPTKQDLHRIKD